MAVDESGLFAAEQLKKSFLKKNMRMQYVNPEHTKRVNILGMVSQYGLESIMISNEGINSLDYTE